MTSKHTEILLKRSVKPKPQYSPSNPQVTAKYHLAIDNETGNMVIVANSSVKRLADNGMITLNDGRAVEIVVSGSKKTCLDYWNTEIRLLKDMNHDKQDEGRNEDGEDDYDVEAPIAIEATLQKPTNTFSTPAPYRRQKTLVRRLSSESILGVSSPKRVAQGNRSKDLLKQQNNVLLSRNSNLTTKNISLMILSSDDEENIDVNDKLVLSRLLKEIHNSREQNRELNQQLTKLTNKMSQFGSMLRSNNNQDLDRYRDPNTVEEFETQIIYHGKNLLEVPAGNAGEYARRVLLILFDPHELQASILPSQQSKRYSKSELDHERFSILNDAIRTRYRISKHHYETFYKERIKDTLAGRIYNIGVRKPRKQAAQQQETEQNDPREDSSPIE